MNPRFFFPLFSRQKRKLYFIDFSGESGFAHRERGDEEGELVGTERMNGRLIRIRDDDLLIVVSDSELSNS